MLRSDQLYCIDAQVHSKTDSLSRYLRPSGTRVPARRTNENAGDILKQLNSSVKSPAGNHVEGDIGITVVDPFGAGPSGDDGEDDHPEAIHEARP